MLAAIYARYSSDRQSERSIDDQVRLCQEHVARLGGSVSRVYADYTISGVHASDRPQLMAMMEDAKAGRFDMIMAEALDRISRDQEHTAAIYKRATFARVKIITVSEGEISELHVGLKGTMSALFIKDLALKTKRGQVGRIAAGFAAGSIGYGYDVVRELDARGEIVAGRRKINEAEAAIIRRIFAEYGTGSSPRSIATDLNKEGIPSPRGGTWNGSTINGNKARRNGILHNELYRGVLTYNRQTFVKDPETGKRVARPNPETEWKRTEVPALRIVEEDVWAIAQARKGNMASVRTDLRRRPKRLLSGLVHCGCCGGAYIIQEREKMGCSIHRDKGMCDNGQRVGVEALETRVMDGL